MDLHDDTDAFADHDVAEWIGSAPDQALIELDREIVRRGGLKAFLQLAWPVIEGGAEFEDNWHVSAICEHLEAVSSGQIKRLAIAVPPRTGKSGMVSVMWPAWDWIMNPSRRFLFASYAHNLSIRDGTRCRRVLQSPWFQQRWGERFRITSDMNTKIKFENNKGGYRLSTSVGGQLTGEGGDIVCLPYDQEILTERGPRQIGDIVSDRQAIRVWSQDVESGSVALKPVLGWHRNPGRPIVRVTLSDGTSFRCTVDHRVWTRRGWVDAGLLDPGDRIPRASAPDGLDRRGRHSEGRRGIGPACGGTNDGKDLFLAEDCSVVQRSARSVVLTTAAGSDLRPGPTSPNVLNGTSAHPITLRQYICDLVALSDLDCLLSRENSPRPHLQNGKGSVSLGVVDVLCPCAVSQVGEPVVGWVTIEVTHFLPLGRRPHESQHYDLVNEEVVRSPVAPGIEAGITARPFLALGGLENASAQCVDRPTMRDLSGFASGATLIRDTVGPLEPRDRTPVLIECVGHADVTFCLTVAEYHTMMLPGYTVVANCTDDANNAVDAESEAVREGTNRWFSESLSTRLNSPKRGAFVLIQQRLHERDLMGYVLKKHGEAQNGGEYTYLCLPMQNDPTHPSRWIRDPRVEDGELLWPSHIPQEVVDTLKLSLGPYSSAGQLQQLPSPREGGIFKRAWFPVVNSRPLDLEYARGWDLAATAKKLVGNDPDYTAGVKIGWSRSAKKWYITSIIRCREEPHKIEELMLLTARNDGLSCRVVIPKDPGQAGVGQAKNLLAMLGGFDVQAEPQSGDKMARAMPLAGQAGGGNICIMSDAGNVEEFLTEITGFPTGAHDDMVDAAASAFTRLTGGTSGIMEFYARQADDQANKLAEQKAKLTNGTSVTTEYTENLAMALMGRKK